MPSALSGRSTGLRPGTWFACLLAGAALAASCGGSDPAGEPGDEGGAGGSGGTGGAGGEGTGGWGGEIVVDARCEGDRTYEACGGPLDGAWTVDHVCGDRSLEVDRIYGDTTAFECWISADLAYEVRGTLSYADQREDADLAIRSRERYVIPDACAAALEPALAPADFCEQFQAALPDDGRQGDCVYGDGGCACDFRSTRTLRRDWAYEPSGALIVEFPADDDEGFSYCVDGDTMVQSRGDMMLHLAR